MTEHWSQTKPYNNLVPAYLPPDTEDGEYQEKWQGHVTAGCVATAMAQTMHYWGCPRQFDSKVEVSHSVNLDKGKVQFGVTHTVAAGVPLTYDDSDECKARLTFIAATLGQLAFDRDGTGGRPETVANALSDYYVVPPTCDDQDLRNYLKLGYPVPATIATHAIVLTGWKQDEKGVEWYWKNNGAAGGGDGWICRDDIKSLHPCFPKKMAMIDPIPSKSKSSFTVTWAFPEVYLAIYPDAFEGFVLNAIPSSAKGTPEVSVTLGRNVRSYTFDSLKVGETYSIEITPKFKALADDDPTVFIDPVTSSVMTIIDADAGDCPQLTAPETAAIKIGEGGEIKLSASKDITNIDITPSLKSYTLDKTTYVLSKYLSVEGKDGDFTIKIKPIDFLGKSDNYNVVLTFKGTVPNTEGTDPIAEVYAETIVTFSASGKGTVPGTGGGEGEVGTDPGTEGTDPKKLADYILISPSAFVYDWEKYIEKRHDAHKELTFAVKNAAEIYDGDSPQYPGNSPQAKIKAFIAEQAKLGAKYFVLGAAWSDISSFDWKSEESFVIPGENGDKYGQVALSLGNTIPGWNHEYHAANKPEGQQDWKLAHDYDYSLVDGDYLADVVIARIPLVPWPKKDGSVASFSEIIEGYGKKVAAVENSDFAGRHRYACAGAQAVSDVSRESEYWPTERHRYADGYYDFFDKLHPDSVADGVIAARRRFRDFFAQYNPIKGAMVIPVGNTAADFFADTKGWEAVIAKCHGLEGAAYGTGINEEGFRETTTLVKFGIFAMPCLTGRPDLTTTWNGWSSIRKPSMGVAAICNPNGGEVVGFHNTHDGAGRYDLEKVLLCEDPYSTQHEGLLLAALCVPDEKGERLNAGEAWLKSHRDYIAKYGSDTWNLYAAREAVLYGDPLIKVSSIKEGEKVRGSGIVPAKVLFR